MTKLPGAIKERRELASKWVCPNCKRDSLRECSYVTRGVVGELLVLANCVLMCGYVREIKTKSELEKFRRIREERS